MFQVIDSKKMKFRVSELEFTTYKQLQAYSKRIFFLHPFISLFFDKLTTFRFGHKEILVDQDFHHEIPENVIINILPPSELKFIEIHNLNFKVEMDGNHLELQGVSPEFGVIWMLRVINSFNVGIALALLEFCDLAKLNQYRGKIPVKGAIDLILELGRTPLNRYDLIWGIIKKNEFEKELKDLPLFLDRNIRIERRYDQQLK